MITSSSWHREPRRGVAISTNEYVLRLLSSARNDRAFLREEFEDGFRRPSAGAGSAKTFLDAGEGLLGFFTEKII